MSHRVELQIPFTGFYHSLHSAAFGNAEEQGLRSPCRVSQSRTCPSGFAIFKGTQQITQTHTSSTPKHTQRRSVLNTLTGGRFSGFTSPTRIQLRKQIVYSWRCHCLQVIELHLKTPQDILNRLAAERHTSRDGFASSYSPEVDTWGPVDTWDHNQLMTLLIAYLENERGEEWDMWAEHELTEDFGCNGELQEWLYPDSPETSRYWKIFNYIVGRSERTIRTAYPQLSETLRDLDAPQLSNLCQSIIDLKS